MSIFFEIGYCDTAYLIGPYFEGTAYDGLSMQVDRSLGDDLTLAGQVLRQIDLPQGLPTQAAREISTERSLGVQAERTLQGVAAALASEVDRQIAKGQALAMEAESGLLRQGSCAEEGYALRPYLTAPYLTDFVCASLGMQVDRRARQHQPIGAQVDRKIVDATLGLLSQVDRRIDSAKTVPMQVQAVAGKILPMQVRKVLYNTHNIRILLDFPSRGANGNNWTVTVGSQAAGDFSPNNLNTDLVEQVFRTQGTSNITVVCDTQISSGIYVDTIGILNHNLRVTGSVRVEGSMTSSFSNPAVYDLRPDGTLNIVWVAPTLPLEAYRYWRFTFNDAGNPANYLQIGTIVFGSALIFQGENIVDTIIRTPKHFADKVQTEGFTSVSNDRALRYALGLEFRSLDYTKENYTLLQKVFTEARTSLKALWIPTPRTPTRFAVFGKLTTLPSESHNSQGDDADYVSFSVEVDESL